MNSYKEYSTSSLYHDIINGLFNSRWEETSPGIWTGVIGGLVWKLKQSQDEIHYIAFKDSPNCCKYVPTDSRIVDRTKRTPKLSSENNIVHSLPGSITHRGSVDRGEGDNLLCRSSANEITKNDSELQESQLVEILADYFQLNINLCELYRKWCSVDPHFDKLSKKFCGIRILRQDPVETLFAFICSSNNNISRISSMVDNLCIQYGEKIAEVDRTQYYSFPSITSLASNGVEEKLRKLGFGYRARYISAAARYMMTHHDEQWLYGLRCIPYAEAKNELIKLMGVGAKVYFSLFLYINLHTTASGIVTI